MTVALTPNLTIAYLRIMKFVYVGNIICNFIEIVICGFETRTKKLQIILMFLILQVSHFLTKLFFILNIVQSLTILIPFA